MFLQNNFASFDLFPLETDPVFSIQYSVSSIQYSGPAAGPASSNEYIVGRVKDSARTFSVTNSSKSKYNWNISCLNLDCFS